MATKLSVEITLIINSGYILIFYQDVIIFILYF